MSILSAIKQQNSSIDDLAKLPQAMIMQMAQKGEIREDMLAPILGRKAEMADAVARTKALQNAGQTPPTVMESLMAQNAQAEQPTMEDTGVAQLPMPERQYAGGGIIAFADGGMSDEDYEDKVRKSRLDEAFGEMMAGLKSLPSRASDMISGFAKSYMPAKEEQSRGSHPYEAQVIQEAKRQGVDPNLALHVLYKETGNLKNPESARSKAGAIGVMQLMPGTAKELGVDPTDPNQNIAGGVAYLKKMYSKYQDPALTAAAYNAGPGRLDKALRADNGLNSLSKETRNYIVGLAEGGEVRHFDEGGYSDLGIPMVTSPDMGTYNTIVPGTPENLLSNKQITPEEYKRMKERQTPKKVAPPQATNEAPPVYPYRQTESTTPEQDYYAELMAQNKESRAELKKSAAEDKNLALLATGLKMLGGSSPYASVNIGNAGAAGVEQYGASKARRAAELAALNKADVDTLYGREIGKIRQAQAGAQQADKLRADVQSVRNKFQEMYKDDPRRITPEGRAQIELEVENKLTKDPLYTTLMQQLGLPLSKAAAPRTINLSDIK